MIYLMCGIPGSGKSYWISKNKSDNSIVISRDKIRFNLLIGDEDYFSHEKEVIKQFRESIQAAAKTDKDVYIDAVHLTKKTRHKVISWIKQTDKTKEITCVCFLPDVKKAIEQNKLRKGRSRVSSNVILSHYYAYQKPELEEGFKEILFIE